MKPQIILKVISAMLFIIPLIVQAQTRPKIPIPRKDNAVQAASSNCNSANMLFRHLTKAREYASSKDYRDAKDYYRSALEDALPAVEKYCPDQLQKCNEELASTLEHFKANGLDLKGENDAKKLIEESRYRVRDFSDRYCKSISENSLTEKSGAEYFLEKAKGLDYLTLVAKLEKAGETNPGLKNEYDYQLITGMKNEFDKHVALFFAETKKAMNYAKTSRAKGLTEARKAYHYGQAAISIVEGVLLILPENQVARNLKQEADQLAGEIGKDYEANVFTSAFHKENVGKILFSGNPIKIKTENPAQFAEKFSASDNLYGLCYLDGAISDIFGYSSKVIMEINVLLDGSHLWRLYFTVLKPEINQTWFSTEIIPDPKTALSPVDALKWEKEILSRIPLGQHELTLQVEHNSKIIASGKIQLSWDNYDAEKIKKNAALACLNAENNLAKTRQLPPEFNKPGGRFSDPDMSVANIRKMILASPEFSDCTEIIKLSIGTDQDWFVNKDGIKILGRFNGRAVRMAYRSKDGWCYYIPNVTFNCTYLGNGKYGPPSPHIPSGSKVKIACGNVK